MAGFNSVTSVVIVIWVVCLVVVHSVQVATAAADGAQPDTTQRTDIKCTLFRNRLAEFLNANDKRTISNRLTVGTGASGDHPAPAQDASWPMSLFQNGGYPSRSNGQWKGNGKSFWRNRRATSDQKYEMVKYGDMQMPADTFHKLINPEHGHGGFPSPFMYGGFPPFGFMPMPIPIPMFGNGFSGGFGNGFSGGYSS